MRYQEILESCWKGYRQAGMKKKGDRMVPNCVPVEEAVDPFLDNTARELLGLVIIAGGAFAVGAYYTVLNKLKKYQGRQIIDALERKGVRFNRETHERIQPLLNQFKQALQDNEGEQARALAKRIEQIIVMGKLSAPEPRDADNALATKEKELAEDLKKWFKEKWVRFGPDGKIRGACARGSSSEGKPKCLPQAKAHALGKKGRASAAAKKRREDPNPERRGPAKNVATKVKEMDKSQPSQERHGDYPIGSKGTNVKTTTKKKVVKDMTKELERALAKEKDIKEEDDKMDRVFPGHRIEVEYPEGRGRSHIYHRQMPMDLKGIFSDANSAAARNPRATINLFVNDEYIPNYEWQDGVDMPAQGIGEAMTDYQKRRQRERDVDMGKPVRPLPKNTKTDYHKRREQQQRDMDMGEGRNIVPAETTIANAKKLWLYVQRNLLDLASNSSFDRERNELFIDEKLNGLFKTASGQPVQVAFDQGSKIEFYNGILYIPVEMMYYYRGLMTSQKFINGVVQALDQTVMAEQSLDEKQDACYHKVRSRYKVWPSAYASGALVQCRKKGAANWGNKTKKE